MHIIIFTHPDFISSQSMPRYTQMLVKGMKDRNHEVEIWTAKRYFHRLPSPVFLKKWLGYIDQFLLFPLVVKLKLLRCSAQILFVFVDHALGPWMPLVSKRPFVVHCHDFLAQRSALGEISENKVKPSGKMYQKLIRSGYRKAEHFISVSEKTRNDLHRFLGFIPKLSQVVYNGLNQEFKPGKVMKVRRMLGHNLNLDLKEGYFLHVGGNQFYKNRKGVIIIYDAWCRMTNKKLPLLMVGSPATEELLLLKNTSSFSSSIYFLTNISDELLKFSYQGASIFLFPSLEEGFGWPIAEAMASGCPVVTTGEAPMNEVGGDCSHYIPRMPEEDKAVAAWAQYSAGIINKVLHLSEERREELVASGIEYAKRFNTHKALGNIESVYKEVHQMYQA